MKEFFCIRNTINEYDQQISGYYETFDEAKAALKHKSDWWKPKGTGKIYKIQFNKETDNYTKEILVYEK